MHKRPDPRPERAASVPYLNRLISITADYQESAIEIVFEEVDKMSREVNAQSNLAESVGW